MATGGIRILLAYAVVVGVLAATRVVLSRWYWSEVLAWSALGGIFVLIGLGYWWEIRGLFQDRRLVRRAVRGEALRDGRRSAALGSLEPLGELLRAPFSGRSCVAYWYVARKPGTQDASVRQRFWGWHLGPSSVNREGASVRLLGYIVAPAWETLKDGQARENAADYVRSTGSSAAPGPQEAPQQDPTHDESAASLRSDCARQDPDLDLQRLELSECCAEPGAIVCAFGRYSSAAGGLLRDRQRSASGIELIVGQPSQVLHSLGQRASLRVLIGGVFVFMGLLAALLGGS